MKNRHIAAFLAASALGLGFAQVASAADLARKAPVAAPMVAPVYNWTGFYVGVHAGWGWNQNDGATTFLPSAAAFGAAPFSFSNDNDGGMLGAQIGVNYQVSNWVFGIEADASWVDWDNSVTVGPIGLFPPPGVIAGSFQTATTDFNFFGTLRGRLGFAANNWLLYVTGGLAWADIDHTVTTSFAATGGGVFVGTSGDTRAGWTIGGGVEWGFAPGWSLKAEYLYYDLGDTTVVATSAAFPGFASSTTFDNTGHIARVGLNYRFGWGAAGPVVARY